MTRTQEGRLYRHTEGFLSRPLFSLSADDWPTHYDEEISSVVIRRGLGSAGGGVAVSTMEVQIPEILPYATVTGRSIRFGLLTSTAQQIAAHTGYTGAPTGLADRFRGRIGPLQVHDTGRSRSSHTVLTASSWIAQERTSKHRANLTKGMSLNDAIEALLYHAPTRYAFTSGGPWDSLLEAIPDASYQSTIDQLTGEYEVLVADRRNGTARALSLPYQWQQAQSRVTTTAHLTRSQAISPAQWVQSSESAARKYRFIMTDANGARWTTTRFLEEQVAPDAETEELDWERFGQLTDHWDYASRAIVHRDNIRAYELPSVKVDLLYLLRSTNPYHRRQAGELLALETGDSINLSGDWPQALRGIQIVTGSTETITGSEWTLDLSLAPMLHVLGYYPPEIPALVWDAATYEWRAETRTWNH